MWTLLVVLVVGMLIIMVWLAGRYEASQVQDKLDRDTAQAVVEIRAGLNRNLQDMQAVNALHATPEEWSVRVAEMLQVRRELLRIEWRDAHMRILRAAQSPYRSVDWEDASREESFSNAIAACSNAKRTSSPAYSPATFSCSMTPPAPSSWKSVCPSSKLGSSKASWWARIRCTTSCRPS